MYIFLNFCSYVPFYYFIIKLNVCWYFKESLLSVRLAKCSSVLASCQQPWMPQQEQALWRCCSSMGHMAAHPVRTLEHLWGLQTKVTQDAIHSSTQLPAVLWSPTAIVDPPYAILCALRVSCLSSLHLAQVLHQHSGLDCSWTALDFSNNSFLAQLIFSNRL